MGAELSNPVDEQKQEQIQNIVSEFVTNFGQIFPGVPNLCVNNILSSHKYMHMSILRIVQRCAH